MELTPNNKDCKILSDSTSLHTLILACSFIIILSTIPCFVFIKNNSFPNFLFYFKSYNFIVIFALFFYLLLTPLHENGHYCIAKYYVKKHNLRTKIYILRSKTVSADWELFSKNEVIHILKAGVHFKFTYCIVMSIFSILLKDYYYLLIFILVIFFEYTFNCTPIPNSDYKSIKNLNLFYDDKYYVFKHQKSLYLFYYPRTILWSIIYPLFLILFSILFFKYDIISFILKI